jgi:hypothetical protein
VELLLLVALAVLVVAAVKLGKVPLHIPEDQEIHPLYLPHKEQMVGVQELKASLIREPEEVVAAVAHPEQMQMPVVEIEEETAEPELPTLSQEEVFNMAVAAEAVQWDRVLELELLVLAAVELLGFKVVVQATVLMN